MKGRPRNNDGRGCRHFGLAKLVFISRASFCALYRWPRNLLILRPTMIVPPPTKLLFYLPLSSFIIAAAVGAGKDVALHSLQGSYVVRRPIPPWCALLLQCIAFQVRIEGVPRSATTAASSHGSGLLL